MCLQNKELISASESGDVMTVVSLLNSGAYVQTKNEVQNENEVYIHFFSYLSSFVHHVTFFTLAFSCLFVPYCRVQ